MPAETERRWIDHLSPDDISFLRRFLLASGTLKQLAQEYGVSYPTIRLRLDRLIEKVRLVAEHEQSGPFELRLRLLYAEGALDDEAFRSLLEAHRSEESHDERARTAG